METTSSTGTGTITLGGAVAGFQSFSVIGNGNTTYYTIVGGTEWEVGIGTYTSSGTTLSRDTVLESSNGGSLVNFSAGTKNVFVTYPAEKSVDLDTAQTLSNKTLASPVITTLAEFPDGTASSPSITNTGDTNTGIFFPAADTIAFTEGGAEAMRLDASGNVGIGTASPSTRLTVGRVDSTSEGGQIDLCRSSDNASSWAIDVFGNTTTPSLRFVDNVAATARMVVDASGNVGIGTSSPTQRLQIYSSGASGGAIQITNASTGASSTDGVLIGYDGSNDVIINNQEATQTKIFTSGAERMRIDSSGNVVINSTETSIFTGVAGVSKFVVTGNNSATTVANNQDACIVIANTDDTANNLTALHFAWQDSDNTPNYASSSIVGILGTKVAGQYPAGQLAFLTSSATNNAPSEKMRITSAGGISFGSSGTNFGTSGQILTSAGNAPPTWQANQALGVGQTWTNVTSSRVTGTTYTNSTGRPIFVAVTWNDVGGITTAGFDFLIDGVIVATARSGSGGGIIQRPFIGIVVPSGSTYSTNNQTGGINKWFELR